MLCIYVLSVLVSVCVHTTSVRCVPLCGFFYATACRTLVYCKCSHNQEKEGPTRSFPNVCIEGASYLLGVGLGYVFYVVVLYIYLIYKLFYNGILASEFVGNLLYINLVKCFFVLLGSSGLFRFAPYWCSTQFRLLCLWLHT